MTITYPQMAGLLSSPFLSYANEATVQGIKCLVNLKVPDKLKSLNSHPHVFLAGGALVRLQHDRTKGKATYDLTKHDLDFFVVGDTPELREEYLREFVASLGGRVTRTNLSYVNVVQEDGTKIQVIMTECRAIKDVVYRFDFSVCRLWLNKANEIEGLMSSCPLTCQEDQANDCVENVVDRQHFVSRQRIAKYEELFGFKTRVEPGVHLVDDEAPKPTQPIPMEDPFQAIRNGFKYQ